MAVVPVDDVIQRTLAKMQNRIEQRRSPVSRVMSRADCSFWGTCMTPFPGVYFWIAGYRRWIRWRG